MSEEQDIKKLEELVKQIEDYADRGVWESQPAEEIAAVIVRAEAVFNRIIEGYITMTGIPPVQQAYQVSDLQERLHRVQHNLPSPPPKPEVQGKIMVDKKVAIYTTPT